jgi:hypothetical protein
MFRNFKVILAVLVVLVLAGAAFAFAASNNVTNSSAGSSANTVSGYDITKLAYNLNADPTYVDTITFTVTPQDTEKGVAATVAKLQTADSGNWKDCTLVAGTDKAENVTCTYSSKSQLMTDIAELNFVITSSYLP